MMFLDRAGISQQQGDRQGFLWLIMGILFWTALDSYQVVRAQTRERQTHTPIKHFIYLMQENHSFDNYFGTYPGADGIPAALCMPVNPYAHNNQRCVKPFHLGDQPIMDLGHTSGIFFDQYNDGRMNGFVYAHQKRYANGALAMGYYDDRDLPYYWNLADSYVLFDRFFTSAVGGSVWNHNFWVAGAPGSINDAIPAEGYGEEFITLFDRLEEHNISWKFYVQNYDPFLTLRTRGEGGAKSAQIVWVPLLNIPRFLDNPHLFQKIVNLEEYYEDLRAGTLPAVAYIVPSGASEHPPGSIRAGQTFVKNLLQALMKSDAWAESAFFWTYDDWGGWYDHVSPPQVDAYGYGFRAPALLVSAYAKQGYVDSTEYDFTSPLKFILENWGLPPLAERDAKANSIADAFDFTQPPRPPVLLSTDRAVSNPKPEPRRNIVMITYSSALLLGLLIIGWAHWDPRFDRRTANRTPTSTQQIVRRKRVR